MDTFRFSISLAPPDAAYLSLLREIAKQMARLAGLDHEGGRQAVNELQEAVQRRFRRAPDITAPVLIAFERAEPGAPVTIDITSPDRDADDRPERLTWGAAGQD